jgi:hypothetical protein
MMKFVLCFSYTLIACASAQYYVGSETTCAKDGERCAGAAGHPLIPYVPCCSTEAQGIHCAKKKTYAANEWGMFCVSRDDTQQTSYARGERCMGAPGKPFVKFLPCRDAGDVCAEDAKLGWGAFCKPGALTTTTPSPADKKTCYNAGERCMGAPGKPFVKYMPPCDAKMVCREEPVLGWGSWVMPALPVPGSSALTCYQSGERCAGAPGKPFVQWLGCCDPKDNCEVDESKGWGSFCKRIAYKSS